MDWIETNGVVLRYDLSGAGRVPLLLIHELGGSFSLRERGKKLPVKINLTIR